MRIRAWMLYFFGILMSYFVDHGTSEVASMDVSYDVKEDLLDLDIAMGIETGVGIRCVVGNPRGEDGIQYCKPLTPQERLRMNKTATELLVVTPYTSQADGRNRFMRSSRVYGYHVKVLGDADEGDVSDKKLLELLTEELSRHNSDNLVLYTHSEDVVLAGGPLRVVEEFERCGCEILVSADGFCWPDRTLESSYPKVERGKRFLNSGGLVGRVGALYRLLKEAPEEESLQLLLSHVYVKDATRNKYSVKLDHLSNLFQNLNGATGDIELRFAGKEAYLQNTLYNTVPVVVRGNGHTALVLHNLGSYLAKAWNPEEGCRPCWDNMIAFEKISEEEYPLVTIAIFIEKETPFMEEFTRKINNLKYPKAKLDLYLHNAEEYHEPGMTEWLETVTPDYRSVKYVGAEENVKEWHARNAAMDYCVERDCKFLFSVDSDGHLDNPHTLKLLIEQNRTVVAPMLIRPYKAWSNFWGAITNDGFYARSMDYMDLVQGQRRGLWNVPYITTCVLVQRSVFDDPETRPSFIKNLLDPDMAFCENLREKGIFMFVSNRVDFGHLVNTDNFDTSRKYSELWQIFDNRWDWEHRYIHPNYSLTVAENATVQMPCPDVYWFPLFKERFASEMIETFEAFGAWSDGSSNDPRLEGGYESVPTIDIHMKQVGMEAEWLELLRAYVQPVQQKVFEGYFNDPPRAIMNFMVRYKPDEQPLLRPHHDTSTYTINVALNRPGVDYQGGGCRFVRYNCSVTDSRVGWVLMHPGRLTHLHEGLRTTEGTRYIIVSFVDP